MWKRNAHAGNASASPGVAVEPRAAATDSLDRHDLRGPLRAGASDDCLSDTIERIWARRSDQYSESRGSEAQAASAPQKVEMSFLGG